MRLKPIASVLACLSLCVSLGAQQDDALLFHLSGDQLPANYSKGPSEPNFAYRVSVVDDGAQGKALRAHYRNTYAYLAPGNIYSERGTIAFNWRSGEEMTETEFPLWRVSFADHTSWDMVWLRIDWNGHGYDAFVTDNNLVRVRLSTTAKTPDPDEWIHVAFSWDESKGVRLYLNGEKLAQRDTAVCLNTGLDQFGPHSRIISPYQVQSAYIVQRGGDIDEVRIYDHQLTDAEVARIARGDCSPVAPAPALDADGWKRFFGFDKSLPPYLENASTAVRKIEITEAYDYKRWYWKACDGLRETTFPGVYNRSRIEGRADYFQLPDWDCYSFSGTDFRFVIPEEWNYVEITGGAFGSLKGSAWSDSKARGTQRSFHRTSSVLAPDELVFTNVVQETPIQEFNAFRVTEGKAPKGAYTLRYSLSDFDSMRNPALEQIEEYIDGRYMEGERAKLLARTYSASAPALSKPKAGGSPVAHVIIPSDCKELDVNVAPTLQPIEEEAKEFGAGSSWNARGGNPCWDRLHAGLDGISITIPALDVKPVDGSGLYPLNIAVMDPLDPMRYMMDFSFSVKPGEERTLWLDVRDRIMPQGKPLYIRISGATQEFDASCLDGARLELVFKEYDLAKEEHITDRFNQVRDNYAILCEESTSSRRYLKFRRFENDLNDLLKVDPDHALGNRYKYIYYPESARIVYEEPVAPKNVPEWAFLQLKVLERWKYLAQWYLDNRQAPNGECGGGLSDESSLTELYVPLAEMDILRERSIDALKRQLQAEYDQGMLLDGVSAIQSDGLHTFEEGENTTVQTATIDPDDPLVRERLLATAHSTRRAYLGVNEKGHLHLKGDYFSATKAALGGRWVWNSMRGNNHMYAPLLAADRFGDEYSKQFCIQFFDSLLDHAVEDPVKGMMVPGEINYLTDEGRMYQKFYGVMMAYMWKWTGDEKYLKVADFGSDFRYTAPEDLVSTYRAALRQVDLYEWYNTHGSPYTDRLKTSFRSLDNTRLGGSVRLLPWNLIAWRFEHDTDAEKVAINVNYTMADDSFEVEFFNVSGKTVKAGMLGRRAADGTWLLDEGGKTREVEFGYNKTVELKIPAGKSYTIKMKKVR